MFDPHAYAYGQRIETAHPLAGFSGVGDVTTPQLESLAATGASSTVAILTALGTVGGPVGAAISAGIGVALAIAQLFKGCGQTCIAASNDANKVGAILQQNLVAYLSSPIRTTSMQAAALNNFDTMWNALVQACSDPALGAAGQRCVSDRQAGACHYHTSPGGWVKNADGTCTYTAPGQDGSGTTCWNWFVGQRDPIANDPCVVPDSVLQALTNPAAASSFSSQSSAGAGASSPTPNPAASSSAPATGLPMPLLLGGVGLLILLAVGGD
jgi:hypothetical protein